MNRSKIVAIITGAISILLALAYLLLVQLLDFRTEMIPAPVSQLPQGVQEFTTLTYFVEVRDCRTNGK
jgi:hypothetical protein